VGPNSRPKAFWGEDPHPALRATFPQGKAGTVVPTGCGEPVKLQRACRNPPVSPSDCQPPLGKGAFGWRDSSAKGDQISMLKGQETGGLNSIVHFIKEFISKIEIDFPLLLCYYFHILLKEGV